MASPVRRQLRSSASPEQQERDILDAAAAEFAEVGVRRANVDEVARRAGVSRSTLYRRFRSKEELLLGVAREVFAEVGQRLAGVTRGHGPQAAVVEAFAEASRQFTENPLLRRWFTTEVEILGTLVDLAAGGDRRLFDEAVALIAGTLRHAGSTMEQDELELASEVLVRVAGSLVQLPSSRVDIMDPESARQFAERYLAPLVR
ncbi:TetR/AcrR family transcriptional regulator [Nocardia huaxiensis]|uniref:TetR/AcrR family transcriptional regulator n=1 Tax=Nocardia huaxiensis TaxID=2755382 RepID=A0A7D6VC08_9NOCA|nr:TetR/AcrR family transcriptional regulator [Nocardia huaxiensis]QLY28675.1 TetR/AcrR family transcriptional regulator [Nocardia huaxiensis]UFS97851.1 TetR/AcrR family transcriptional regulator [Nocardia huaxiensis]